MLTVLTVCCQSFNQTIGRMRIDTGPFQRYGIHILEEYQLDWRNWVRQHVKEVALINIRAGKARAIAGHEPDWRRRAEDDHQRVDDVFGYVFGYR